MVKNVLVLGAGSAGLLAAISLKRKIPELSVQVVRSPDIGVIGVGEGTTPNFPGHMFDFLGMSRRRFYEMAQPTWKLGIRFIWGPRGQFFYGFAPELDQQWSDLPRPNGFYCDEDLSDANLPTALMNRGKAFARQKEVPIAPDVQDWHGFHLENRKLVDVLEQLARATGVEITDGKVSGATRGSEGGVTAVHLDDGRTLTADFFVDASGFRSELLGKTLGEPYVPFAKQLFCDRAVVGGWERGPDEPILPYTTVETMEAGWAWQIEHEHLVNRGYVFCSGAISDEDARAEFLRKNPKAAKDGRVVKFRSGRYARAWVDNVCAIGNAGGFVEPLEATSLMVICWQCQTLVQFLQHTAMSPTPSIRTMYNHILGDMWDEIRDFLALHYQLNTMLDTPFWRQCRAETDLSGIGALMEFYEQNGPTGFARYLLRGVATNFGIEGFLAMLVGNKAPYRPRHHATAAEREIWDGHRAAYAADAAAGMDVREALAVVRRPEWRWFGE